MNLIKLLSLFTLLFFNIQLGYAFKFNEIEGYKGSVITTFEDSKGQIWFGTADGIALFNGFDFKWYKHNKLDSNSISSNYIESFCEDRLGNFWIGTRSGLNYFNTKTEKATRYLPSNSNISNERIRDVVLQNDSIIWICTYGGGLNKLHINTGRFEVFNKANGFPSDYVNTIFKENETTIWIGTENGGLSRLNPKTNKFYHFLPNNATSHGFTDHTVACVVKYQNQLWIGTWNKGLFIKDKYSDKFAEVPCSTYSDYTQSDTKKIVKGIAFDQKGNCWIGTGNSLNFIDAQTKELKIFRNLENHKDVITSGRIWNIKCASTGIIWFSFLYGGVCKFDYFANKLLPLNIKENGVKKIADGFTTSQYLDKNGNYWIGNYYGDLKCYNYKTKTLLKSWHNKFNKGEIIFHITERNKNEIWVSTFLGIHIINDKYHAFYSNSQIAQNNKITTTNGIFHSQFDKQGNAYVGGWNSGFIKIPSQAIQGSKIDFSKAIIYTTANSILGSNNILNLIVDSKDRLWIGCDAGTYVYANNQLTMLDNSKDAYAIEEINNKIIVKGSYNGTIDYWDGKKWKLKWDLSAYCSKIFSIIYHNDSLISIGTVCGLILLNPKNTKITKLDENDGLTNNNMVFGEPVLINNQLLCNTREGISILNIKEIHFDKIAPKPILMAIEMNNEVHELFNKALSNGKVEELSHNQNKLNFTFSTVYYSKVDKIQFQYILKGHDHNWTTAKEFQRNANYAALAPGEYTFLVKACNADGVWSKEVELYKFQINKPWWNNYWAYLFYFILVGIAIFFINNFTLIKVKSKNELEIQKIMREKDAEIQDVKLNFFTNVSHDLRTPLTLIIGPLQNVLAKNEFDFVVKQSLQTVERNALHLLELVNELLEFRKITNKDIALIKSKVNVFELVKEISTHYTELSKLKNIELIISGSKEASIFLDLQKMKKVFHNLISNAFKHTPESGKINIEIDKDDEYLAVLISDTGKGVSPEMKPFLFDNFKSSEDGGIGIGLALVKEIIKAHEGSIELLDSQIGATFLIQIPDNSSINTVNRPIHFENRSKPVLLLVEDNLEIAQYIQLILAESFNIILAKNGRIGLDIALSEDIDIILSDVMMPEMDGIELCKRIKTNQSTSHIPIVLLTARTSIQYELIGLDSGADDYISKPFNDLILLKKLSNIVQSRKNFHRKLSLDTKLEFENEIKLPSSDDVLVNRIIELIKENLTNSQLSVEWLSTELGMDRSHLTRKLKSITGSTPIEFITSIRLKRAIQLLESGRMNVSEVAYEVGFSSPNYFSTALKKQFGKNPSDFVKSPLS